MGNIGQEDDGFAFLLPGGLSRKPYLEIRMEDSKPPVRRDPYVPVPFILIKGERW
jgi:hypothetical protein